MHRYNIWKYINLVCFLVLSEYELPSEPESSINRKNFYIIKNSRRKRFPKVIFEAR